MNKWVNLADKVDFRGFAISRKIMLTIDGTLFVSKRYDRKRNKLWFAEYRGNE